MILITTISHGRREDVAKQVATHKHIDNVQHNKKDSLNLMLMKQIKESLKENIYFHHWYWVIVYH